MAVSLPPMLEKFVTTPGNPAAFDNANEGVHEASVAGERSGFAEDPRWDRPDADLDAEVEADGIAR